jgi:hypothetical protein
MTDKTMTPIDKLREALECVEGFVQSVSPSENHEVWDSTEEARAALDELSAQLSAQPKALELEAARERIASLEAELEAADEELEMYHPDRSGGRR